jgi:hypothetical protein
MYRMVCPKHTMMARILAPCAVHQTPLYKRPVSRGTFIFSNTRAPSGIVCHHQCPSFGKPCFGSQLQVCLLPVCLGLPSELLAAVQWNLHTHTSAVSARHSRRFAFSYCRYCCPRHRCSRESLEPPSPSEQDAICFRQDLDGNL